MTSLSIVRALAALLFSTTILVAAPTIQAQEAESVPEPPATEPDDEEARPHQVEVDAQLDPFFGFHLHGRGAVPVHPMVDVTVHAVLWTSPALAGGTLPVGQNLWGEGGVGARLVALDAALWVGLELGITHGAFLSDGSQGVAFDGLAPKLYVDYRDSLIPGVVGLEGHAEVTYYTALRVESAEPRNAVRTLAWAGAVLFDLVPIGPYFEHFWRTIRTSDASDSDLIWIGGYVGLRLPVGFEVGMAFGADVAPSVNESPGFYKIMLGWRG